MNKEEQKQLENWNPEEAKQSGTLKSVIEFKIEAEHNETEISFSEPKKKKKINTTPSIIKLGKSKNKNALF